MFIKGEISFDVDKHHLVFKDQNITSFGITGLPWPPLDPVVHYGRSTLVRIKVKQPKPFEFVTPAQLTREYTPGVSSMGIRFQLSDEDESSFNRFAKEYGHPPVVYTRKIPRIPGRLFTFDFPMQALVSINSIEAWKTQNKESLVTFEIINISPSGILLSSENPLAFKLRIEEPITFLLDPTGWFHTQIRIKGRICRIQDDFNLGNGNTQRSIGIEFASLGASEKKEFALLLRTILLRIQSSF